MPVVFHLPYENQNLPQTATDQLLNTPTDVDSFVRYLDSVEEVATIIPSMEQWLLTLTNLYNVAQEFEVSVPEEQLALYKALFPQFRYLKVCNSYLHHPSISLQSLLIPEGKE